MSSGFLCVGRFRSGLGSDPVARHVGDFPRQSEGGWQCHLRPDQLEHGVRHHQNLPGYDGESQHRGELRSSFHLDHEKVDST